MNLFCGDYTIKVGTHASDSGVGTQQIRNHASPGSYSLTLSGTMADEGATELVIIESVIASGEVESYLDFVVLGVDAGETVNADPVPTFATTTATSVAFGTVVPDTEYVLAQDIAVTTNAGTGFTVTVSARGDLASLSGSTIDSFADGTATGTPTAWLEPSSVSGDTDTYGHWGLTTEDITLSDNDSFGDAKYVGNFIMNAREIMYSTTSADGATPHVGLTRVGYKLEITAMQEAAADYSTALIYIVTPTF